MTFDLFVFFVHQQERAIQQLIKLDSEVQGTVSKKIKEEQAERIRKALLSTHPHLCYHFLAVSNKDSADKFRSTWTRKNMIVNLVKPAWDGWEKINTPKVNLSILPRYSFEIQFTFKLGKPFISREEQELYIIDNPIRKDKTFGLPCVSPSSWKGSLRSALWQLGSKEDNEQIQRLFGNERATEDESKLRRGRLHFCPTFFNKISLEVINPHDREKRVGRRPICFESVPIGAEGIFTLLYVPFDRVGENEFETERETASDVKMICNGIHAMFVLNGFGAKTSSGFGTASPDLTDGRIDLRTTDAEIRQIKRWEFKDFDEFLTRAGEISSSLTKQGCCRDGCRPQVPCRQ